MAGTCADCQDYEITNPDDNKVCMMANCTESR